MLQTLVDTGLMDCISWVRAVLFCLKIIDPDWNWSRNLVNWRSHCLLSASLERSVPHLYIVPSVFCVLIWSTHLWFTFLFFLDHLVSVTLLLFVFQGDNLNFWISLISPLLIGHQAFTSYQVVLSTVGIFAVRNFFYIQVWMNDLQSTLCHCIERKQRGDLMQKLLLSLCKFRCLYCWEHPK